MLAVKLQYTYIINLICISLNFTYIIVVTSAYKYLLHISILILIYLLGLVWQVSESSRSDGGVKSGVVYYSQHVIRGDHSNWGVVIIYLVGV